MIEMIDICRSFGNLKANDNITLKLKKGEIHALLGENGAGKSTFIKLLLGEVPADSGTWDIGSTVRFGYYAQTGLKFDEGKKVIDIVRDISEVVDLGGGEKMTASQFLQMFLFSPSQQYDFVGKLSGGERQRLHLCTVLMRSPNFLILDEPTNDLDIPTLNVLEQYLKSFRGCLIVISHDRYFMDKVVDHIFVFHGEGNVQDFPGNYTQYREEQRSKIQDSKPIAQVIKSEKVKTEQKRRLTFKEKKELEELELRLPQLEEEKTQLETLLSGGSSSADEIATASKRYQEVLTLLDEAELRWLELSEIE